MVVFGMAVTMLLSSMNSQGRAHVNISLRTVAHWVAMNQMAEVRMQEEWPNVGTTRGDAQMRNHKWYWLQTVSKTTDKDLRQVEVEVRYDEKDELPTTRFVGFIANKDATGESGASRRNDPRERK